MDLMAVCVFSFKTGKHYMESSMKTVRLIFPRSSRSVNLMDMVFLGLLSILRY